jgi:hypothetical protein
MAEVRHAKNQEAKARHATHPTVENLFVAGDRGIAGSEQRHGAQMVS